MNLTRTPARGLLALVVLVLVATACGSNVAVVEDADPATDSSTTTTTVADDAQGADPDTDTGEPDSEAAPDDVAMTDASWPNPDLFFDGALAEDVTTEECTLSGGTATTCYRITVVGYPADYDVGPFCPDTIEATADDAGIWFDGNGIYDLDGDFIVGLPDLYNDDTWRLYEDDGTVRVTDTPEAFDAAARPDVDPEYQNYCVEGQIEWLDSGEPVPTTVLIPTIPVPADNATQSRGNLGVTLNGVSIAAAAPVDAILGAYTIAAFDDCGGHINPFDGYHLHGAVGCGEVEVDGHSAIFGYALDGYAIHNPYDENGDVYTDLDVCGGHTTEDLGYHYHASPAAENSVLGCLTGEIAQ